MEDAPASPSPLPEYSYFRADGYSLAALTLREEALKEDAAARAKLCAHFGAADMMGGYEPKENRYRFMSFVFHPPEQPVPAGWKIQNEQGPNIVFALPMPGTADDFNLNAITGLMLRDAKQVRLENLFACGEMPYKDVPAGTYSAAFLQYKTHKDGTPVKPDGSTITQRWMTYSNSACKISDPLEALKIGNDWFIRVPNVAESDVAVMVPPDARPVSYDSMLKIEKAEHQAKLARANTGMGGQRRGH